MSNEAFIVDAVRTPLGRLGGALAGVRADDLLAGAVKAVVERAPSLDPASIDEVYAGDANGAGEDNRNVGRMAVLLAGLPTTIPAATVNRLCGSGIEAIFGASRTVAVGDADITIACGVESMTRAPWVMLKPSKAYPTTHEQMWNSALGWRMVNPKMPGEWTISLGEGAEVLADKYSISRDEQDAFALGSHQRAAAAWAAGHFAAETVQVAEAPLERDECIRPDSSMESLAKLKPVFRQGGSVTAGNASPMNDGAAAMLVMSQRGVELVGRNPDGQDRQPGDQWRRTASLRHRPGRSGPRLRLRRAGIGWGDIAAVELNEAFAAQSLACLREWPELDQTIVNPQGGAIAIGHPLGCSGVRIVTTLAHHLRRTGGRYGLAAMCIGVGQGIAIVIENLPDPPRTSVSGPLGCDGNTRPVSGSGPRRPRHRAIRGSSARRDWRPNPGRRHRGSSSPGARASCPTRWWESTAARWISSGTWRGDRLVRSARLIESLRSSSWHPVGEGDEQDQRTGTASVGVLEMHDEAVGDAVDGLDHAVDLAGADAHAATIQRCVGAAGDDATAVLVERDPIAVPPHAGVGVEVGGAAAATRRRRPRTRSASTASAW